VDGDRRHVAARGELETEMRPDRPSVAEGLIHSHTLDARGVGQVELQGQMGRAEAVNDPVAERAAARKVNKRSPL
jgi:hypothetical protein